MLRHVQTRRVTKFGNLLFLEWPRSTLSSGVSPNVPQSVFVGQLQEEKPMEMGTLPSFMHRRSSMHTKETLSVSQ